MSRVARIFACLLVPFCVGTAEDETARSAKPSTADQSRYDRLGPLDDELGDPTPMVDKVRRFVWNHWKQRQPACVVFTGHTKEGEPTTTTIYVETAMNGDWHIRGVIECERADRRPIDDPRHKPNTKTTHSYDAFSLQRVGVGTHSEALRLKDRAGKIVATL